MLVCGRRRGKLKKWLQLCYNPDWKAVCWVSQNNQAHGACVCCIPAKIWATWLSSLTIGRTWAKIALDSELASTLIDENILVQWFLLFSFAVHASTKSCSYLNFLSWSPCDLFIWFFCKLSFDLQVSVHCPDSTASWHHTWHTCKKGDPTELMLALLVVSSSLGMCAGWILQHVCVFGSPVATRIKPFQCNWRLNVALLSAIYYLVGHPLWTCFWCLEKCAEMQGRQRKY